MFCPAPYASHVTCLTCQFLPLVSCGGNCCQMSSKVLNQIYDVPWSQSSHLFITFFKLYFQHDMTGFTASYYSFCLLYHILTFLNHFFSCHLSISFSSSGKLSYFLYEKSLILPLALNAILVYLDIEF